MVGLPSGRDQKGGIPKCKRSRISFTTPTVVSCLATQHSQSSSLIGVSSLSTSVDPVLVSPQILSNHCSTSSSQLNRHASVSVANFASCLQNTQVGNSTATLPAISQSLVISGNSSSLKHSEHPVSLSGVNMSPSLNVPTEVPNTNPFYVKAIEANI